MEKSVISAISDCWHFIFNSRISIRCDSSLIIMRVLHRILIHSPTVSKLILVCTNVDTLIAECSNGRRSREGQSTFNRHSIDLPWRTRLRVSTVVVSRRFPPHFVEAALVLSVLMRLSGINAFIFSIHTRQDESFSNFELDAPKSSCFKKNHDRSQSRHHCADLLVW